MEAHHNPDPRLNFCASSLVAPKPRMVKPLNPQTPNPKPLNPQTPDPKPLNRLLGFEALQASRQEMVKQKAIQAGSESGFRT